MTTLTIAPPAVTSTTTTVSNFVSPSTRPELGGELGLTVHELAQSLGVETHKVLVKIERMVEGNRLKSLYRPYELYNDNNRLVNSYVLDVDNAKFFVAKWDSEIGDAYTRFLIECEKALTQIAANPFLALKGMTSAQIQLFSDSVKATEDSERVRLYQEKILNTSQQNNSKVRQELNTANRKILQLDMRLSMTQFFSFIGVTGTVSSHTRKQIRETLEARGCDIEERINEATGYNEYKFKKGDMVNYTDVIRGIIDAAKAKKLK